MQLMNMEIHLYTMHVSGIMTNWLRFALLSICCGHIFVYRSIHVIKQVYK